MSQVVARANSASLNEAAREFRDAYVDRDVAWGGATLLDVKIPPGPRGKKALAEAELPPMVATLEWSPAAPVPTHALIPLLDGSKKAPPTRIVAKLSPHQYLEVTHLPKGQRLMVRGRFWELGKGAREVELRDALLFEDRDVSKGANLADPRATAACPLATNDLTGLSPNQPGGFAH